MMNKPILIIDDEADIRESISGILEDEGFSTLSAPTAEEGLELMETESVGLVLLGQPGRTAQKGSRSLFLTNDFKEARRLFEHKYLQQKLEENQGNITRTAEMVGLERSHLHKKLKSLDIIN